MPPEVGTEWHGMLSCKNIYLILGVDQARLPSGKTKVEYDRVVCYVVNHRDTYHTGRIVKFHPFGKFQHQAKDCPHA